MHSSGVQLYILATDFGYSSATSSDLTTSCRTCPRAHAAGETKPAGDVWRGRKRQGCIELFLAPHMLRRVSRVYKYMCISSEIFQFGLTNRQNKPKSSRDRGLPTGELVRKRPSRHTAGKVFFDDTQSRPVNILPTSVLNETHATGN